MLETAKGVLRSSFRRAVAALHDYIVRRLTEHRERHGIPLSLYIEAAPLDAGELWLKLEAALDLIAQHAPARVRRMRRVARHAAGSCRVRRAVRTPAAC